ncbi:MAG: DUF6588 family protein [Bdellovibrionota bacterium]
MKTSKSTFIQVIFLSFLATSNAYALSNFNPGNLSGMLQSGVDSLINTVALGSDYRAYSSARPLGMLLGFDAGVDVTVITVPQAFKDAMSVATGTATSSIPAQIPLPRMTFRKGLPKGFDIGFSLFPDYQGLFKTYGAGIQWAPMWTVGIDLAFRLSGNYTKLYFLATHCYSLDAVVSKKFFVFEPYMGLGLQDWSGSMEASLSTLPVGVSGSQSGISPHFFGGLGFKMLIIKLVGEFNYSTEGISTWGLKASLNF